MDDEPAVSTPAGRRQPAQMAAKTPARRGGVSASAGTSTKTRTTSGPAKRSSGRAPAGTRKR